MGSNSRMIVQVLFPVDGDVPVAEILYRGHVWAEVRPGADGYTVTFYSDSEGVRVPLDDAKAALDRAVEELRDA